MSAIFYKISPDQFSLLQEVLLERLPVSTQIYNVLQTLLNRTFDAEQSFYCYNGLDMKVTCIATKVETPNRIYWIILGPVNCETKSLHQIMEAFSKMINWDVDNSFNAVADDVYEYFKEICVKHNGHRPVGPGVVYYMPIQDALNLDFTSPLPLGVEVRQLTREDMKLVFGNWKYADDNPDKEYITESALRLASAGLFLNTLLVSWGIDMMDGGIHAVHTLEAYRGRGYGKTVMKHICNLAAKKCGHVPLVHIESDNKVSIALMESVGFKFSHSVIWTEYDGLSTRSKALEISHKDS